MRAAFSADKSAVYYLVWAVMGYHPPLHSSPTANPLIPSPIPFFIGSLMVIYSQCEAGCWTEVVSVFVVHVVALGWVEFTVNGRAERLRRRGVGAPRIPCLKLWMRKMKQRHVFQSAAAPPSVRLEAGAGFNWAKLAVQWHPRKRSGSGWFPSQWWSCILPRSLIREGRSPAHLPQAGEDRQFTPWIFKVVACLQMVFEDNFLCCGIKSL